MPRPMQRENNEKSKDFFGSMKRLLSNLKKWNVLLIISLLLAMMSAIFSIITPNKLSNFADYISEGLKPDTELLKKITEEIIDNLNNIDYKKESIRIINSDKISIDDKDKFSKILSSIQDENNKELALKSIPTSILKELLEPIEVNNNVISVENQIELLSLIGKMNNKTDKVKLLENFDLLPEEIYELVKPKMDKDKIKNIVILLATLYILSALFNYIQSFSMATISNNFAKNLRSKISTKINKLPLKYFDSHEQGDILSRVTNDVDTIAQNLNNSLSTLVASVTLFIGSIIMMFATNWIMALTAIISSLIGFVAMILILKNSQKYFSLRQKHLGDLNGYIEEMYSGHNVVKAYNGTKKSKEEFKILNDNLYEANRKSQFLSGLMQPIMGFVGNFGYVAVCIVGSILVLNGNTTFGVIVAFMIYVRLFTNPLSQIAQAMTSLQSTGAASERVFEFLDEKQMPNEDNLSKKLSIKDAVGNIEFKHVKFGYDEGRTIIKDFTAKANKGDKIAVVGPTGAGKTTLVNLLMKFYEIDDGEILIDGISTKDLTRENIHDLFCMVLQDTWLFEGTIRDNIKFNREDVSDEKIWEALKTVGIDHFVKTLPGGLDAKLGDTDSISSGQKQLFTIARGMIEDAPFLILDEATSNVDTRTEELVQKAMDKLTVGKTSFIIAHRLSTIKNADLILVMKDGNIIETGNHEELMKKNGFYADLYNSQFEL